MKFQDIKIKIQQTKSALKWFTEIIILIQFLFYCILFYKINYEIFNAIGMLIKEHYPLREIKWGFALKQLNFRSPLLYSLFIDLLFIPGVYFIFRWSSNGPVKDENKNEKIIRGSKIETVKKYKKTVNIDDIFCWIGNIPVTFEAISRNLLVFGATGAGKTQVISKILSDTINKYDYNAVINDNKKDYVSKFYNPERDIIFNPADARCPAWNILDEVEDKSDAATVAEIMIPEPDKSNPNGYFIDNARHVLEAIITFLKVKKIATNENLVDYANKPIDVLLGLFKSHPAIEKECILAIRPLQSDEVKSMMTEISRYLKAFTIMPSKPDKPGMRSFNITRDFLKKRKTRIFLNLDENSKMYVRPIMSVFVTLLIKKFLSAPDAEPESWSKKFKNPRPNENTPTILVFDEMSSFNKVPGATDILDKGRSKNATSIVGIQDQSKMNDIYGENLVKNIMNSCNNAVYLRVNNAAEAEWVSQQVGEQEVERISTSDSSTDDKYTYSKSSQVASKRLFLPSEILTLSDLEAIVKLVTVPYFFHINIIPQAYKTIADGFIKSDRLKFIDIVDEKKENQEERGQKEIKPDIEIKQYLY